MSIRQAPTPRRPLYRIGHLPDPLAWLPTEFAGGGRFDDPQEQFRTLYAAAQRRGAFVETMARFRPPITSLAQIGQLETSTSPAPTIVPAEWYERRGVAEFRLLPGQRWLDLRAPETREELRAELANTLLALGLSDLDLSRVAGPRRSLTQAIARWSYDHGYAGAAYHSRLDARLTLWAVFEGAAFEPVGHPEPMGPNDPDLVAVARLFGLGI